MGSLKSVGAKTLKKGQPTEVIEGKWREELGSD